MQEASRCLICENAPCSRACKAGDPARAVRAILFRNEANAGNWFAPCSEEDLMAAEKACIHYDRPVRLRDLAHALPDPVCEVKRPQKVGRFILVKKLEIGTECGTAPGSFLLASV